MVASYWVMQTKLTLMLARSNSLKSGSTKARVISLALSGRKLKKMMQSPSSMSPC